MRLSDALTRAGAPATAGHEEARWLAVGAVAARALRDALPGAPGRVRRVEDVHRALEVLDDGPFEGCVVDGRRLADRPRAALALLLSRVGAKRVFVLATGTSPTVRRVAKSLGVVLCAPGGLRDAASPLPRADRPPEARLQASPGRFAAGCLERHGDPQALMAHLLDTLVSSTGAARVSLMLVDEARRALLIRQGVGLGEGLVGTLRCPVGRGIAGRVAALGRPLMGHGAAGGRRAYPGRAYVVLPLGRGEACVGVVNLTGFPGDRLPDDRTVGRWEQVAHLAGHALDTAHRLVRAESLMAIDPLTQLANRRAFEGALLGEVERAGRAGTGLAVAMFDLDHFKRVNDEHGHQAGDRVLVQVARLLESSFRESDLVARWGGEEFVVLLPGLDAGHPEAAMQALDRARTRIARRPLALGPGLPTHAVTASCGVALLPADGQDPSTLVRAADRALYAAKEAGRNTIRRA